MRELHDSLELMEKIHEHDLDKKDKELESEVEQFERFKKSHCEDTVPNIDSAFDCPVCYEMMAPPRRIFECKNGHLICEFCEKRPEIKTCPTCRGNLGRRGQRKRSLAMESVVELYCKKLKME